MTEDSRSYKFGSLAVHAGVEPDPSTGALMTPIYQTSTFAQSIPGVHKGYEYARTHNPTRSAFEKAIAVLEGGNHGLAFASGMAAVDTIAKLLAPGDEILCFDDLYGGTYRIFTKVYTHLGIGVQFDSFASPEEWQAKITSATRMVWLETPSNPLLRTLNIRAIAKVCKEHGLILVVDNTFATPCLQRPLELGANIVVHSVTKYLGGHSDLVMGAVVVNDSALYEKLAFLQNACGAVAGPMDSFLALRGLKTLHLRMKAHCENANHLANYLVNHPKVKRVYYPGFEAPEWLGQQMNGGFGGMVSFELQATNEHSVLDFIRDLRLFTLAESLGGVESLIGHPATMTHASIPIEIREAKGITNQLLRLSVGIEAVEDLIHDLEQALLHV
jgi:cystathionine beta-lyase